MIRKVIKKLPGIKQIVGRFQNIQNEISGLRKRISNLEKENKNKAEEITLLKKEIKELESNLKSYEQENVHRERELKAEIEGLKKKDASVLNNLETFKSRYGRERYQMRMEMRTNLYKALPEEKYVQEVKNWYLLSTGKVLDLDNPKTYNEKLQWIKLFEHNPDKTTLSDKYLVREYVQEKIGEKYLVPLLGVWNNFDEIDFSKLPKRFVLKANHGCGYNLVVQNKDELDLKDAKEKFDKWITTNFAYVNFELHYKDIKPLIIAEEYIENENEDLYDYKVWCFNGEPKYIMYLANRKKGLQMVFYDTEWNRMPFTYSVDVYEGEVLKPDNLEELLDISRKLSAGFNHVRVDFYRLNDGAYKFGEMTFTSAAGKAMWNPPEYDRILGDMFEI
ncbi:MAG: glycosyltransferase [Lachnospiraceae bacterium]|nr:glycosyltransferase [Lachnospiraceae bacterium]